MRIPIASALGHNQRSPALVLAFLVLWVAIASPLQQHEAEAPRRSAGAAMHRMYRHRRYIANGVDLPASRRPQRPGFVALPKVYDASFQMSALSNLRASSNSARCKASLSLGSSFWPGGGLLQAPAGRSGLPNALRLRGSAQKAGVSSSSGRVVATASKKDSKNGDAEATGRESREKVKSPMTGRPIYVGGTAYQKIIDLGYILIDGQLVHRNCVQEGVVDAQCSVSLDGGPAAASDAPEEGVSGGDGKKSKKGPVRGVKEKRQDLPSATVGGESARGGADYVEVDDEVNLTPGVPSLDRQDDYQSSFWEDGSLEGSLIFFGGAQGTDGGADVGDWEVDSLQIDDASAAASAADERQMQFSAPFWMRWRDEQLMSIFNELKDSDGKVGLIQLRAALLEVNVNLRAELLWDLLNVADGDGLVRLDYADFTRLVVGVLESSDFRWGEAAGDPGGTGNDGGEPQRGRESKGVGVGVGVGGLFSAAALPSSYDYHYGTSDADVVSSTSLPLVDLGKTAAAAGDIPFKAGQEALAGGGGNRSAIASNTAKYMQLLNDASKNISAAIMNNWNMMMRHHAGDWKGVWTCYTVPPSAAEAAAAEDGHHVTLTWAFERRRVVSSIDPRPSGLEEALGLVASLHEREGGGWREVLPYHPLSMTSSRPPRSLPIP